MSLFIYERDENGTPTHFYIGRLRFKIDQSLKPIPALRLRQAQDDAGNSSSTSVRTRSLSADVLGHSYG